MDESLANRGSRFVRASACAWWCRSHDRRGDGWAGFVPSRSPARRLARAALTDAAEAVPVWDRPAAGGCFPLGSVGAERLRRAPSGTFASRVAFRFRDTGPDPLRRHPGLDPGSIQPGCPPRETSLGAAVWIPAFAGMTGRLSLAGEIGLLRRSSRESRRRQKAAGSLRILLRGFARAKHLRMMAEWANRQVRGPCRDAPTRPRRAGFRRRRRSARRGSSACRPPCRSACGRGS